MKLPEWYVVYPGIYDNYRPVMSPYEAFLSMFTWHTETLNIYTHLLPGLYYLWELMTLKDEGSLEKQFLVYVSYSGAAIMGITSGLAHTFFIIDRSWNDFSWKLDFLGIISINLAHILLDTFVLSRLLHIPFIPFAALEVAFSLYCCYGIISDIHIGRFWGLMYPAITCIPLTSVAYIYSRIIGAEQVFLEITDASIMCSLYIMVAGLVFFKGGFPERYYNAGGIFNILNSHVLHHIFINVSIVAAFEALPKLYLID